MTEDESVLRFAATEVHRCAPVGPAPMSASPL